MYASLHVYASLHIYKNIFKQKHFSQITAWDDTDAEMLCAISENAHKRLEAVVEANGGYIEQK